jgi:DNA-binding MarR family transcriptional regulator
MTTPRAFNGRDINVAAAATRAILTGLLDEAGLTFDQHVALRLLVTGGPGERDEVVDRDGGPGFDRAAVRAALTELESAGLASGDERVEPTERGRELYERITAATVRAGDRLFEGIPADDQAVAKRVLDLVTERAVAVRAELRERERRSVLRGQFPTSPAMAAPVVATRAGSSRIVLGLD